MTDREIERLQNCLPGSMLGRLPALTTEQKILALELDCRNLINSFLVNWGPSGVREGSFCYERYLREYEHSLGKDVVLKLCDEQIEDFKKASVKRCAYIDEEGNAYSSIIWADVITDEVLELLGSDLKEDGPENGVKYVLADGKYQIFAYVDNFDGLKTVVFEPAKLVGSVREGLSEKAFYAAYSDVSELRAAVDLCLSSFAKDKYGVAEVLRDACERSGATMKEHAQIVDFIID